MRQDLRRGAECTCVQSTATCRELLEREEHLWTFLRAEGVDSTNNAAERALPLHCGSPTGISGTLR